MYAQQWMVRVSESSVGRFEEKVLRKRDRNSTVIHLNPTTTDR
jgi:poly-gamma-glutamate capsule biosynthesis protein CapA/YwtB (metallophosphatase superfamily)